MKKLILFILVLIQAGAASAMQQLSLVGNRENLSQLPDLPRDPEIASWLRKQSSPENLQKRAEAKTAWRLKKKDINNPDAHENSPAKKTLFWSMYDSLNEQPNGLKPTILITRHRTTEPSLIRTALKNARKQRQNALLNATPQPHSLRINKAYLSELYNGLIVDRKNRSLVAKK